MRKNIRLLTILSFDKAVIFSGVCTGHVLKELILIKFKNFFVDQLVPLAFGVRPNNLRICIDGQKLEKLQSVLYVMEPRLSFVRGVEIRQSIWICILIQACGEERLA